MSAAPAEQSPDGSVPTQYSNRRADIHESIFWQGAGAWDRMTARTKPIQFYPYKVEDTRNLPQGRSDFPLKGGQEYYAHASGRDEVIVKPRHGFLQRLHDQYNSPWDTRPISHNSTPPVGEGKPFSQNVRGCIPRG
jgi:hypothetical protein